MITTGPHQLAYQTDDEQTDNDARGRVGFSLHDPRSTVRMASLRGIGFAVPGFSPDCLKRLIDYPEMPLRIGTREIVKQGRTALLVRTELPIGGRMAKVAYKRVRRLTWLKRLTSLVRMNRTLKTWRMGHEFLRRGIATARPLAVIIPHRRDVARPSFLALEWIEAAENLHEFCRSAAGRNSTEQGTRMNLAAASLARLLGRMHAEKISHRDLKPGNLLLAENNGAIDSYVIDLDGAEIHNRLSRQQRLRNISRIAAGVAEFRVVRRSVYLRFLQLYLRATGDDLSEWKTIWLELQAMVATRAEQKRRKQAA